MIDICADNLTIQYLKEDIGHFRNTCQHTNMELLKNVLKRLKDRTDDIIKRTEESEGGEQKLKELLSSQNENSEDGTSQVSAFLSGDVAELNPDELILLANCSFNVVEEKEPLMTRVSFFIDVCKIILDTLRQNSKMLDFYNQTAGRVFDFCAKYHYKIEYTRVSDTLHSHFNQILKQSKHPELFAQSKIPFPVRLDEEDALQKVLELRYHQLKIALQMKVWSEAFRTTDNIYQLINRQKHHHSRMKQILADFFTNLSEIFWQSEFYLFHAYAIMNLQQISKFNKAMTEQEKASMTCQFVLAVLSVPLNNRLSNFERLSVQYIPPGMEQLQESTSSARHELFSIANMLQVKGIPSRSSLINYLKVKNLHLQPEFPDIQELFRLIEDEESPFTISKKGRAIIEKIGQNEQQSQYKDFLVKTLSVRILQKCRNYYKNLKMSTLQKLLQFYTSFNQIEFLLYECNREGLVQTILDHKTQSVTFDQEVEVASNLLRFGHRLRDAFQKVQNITSEGKERERIFMKVKEKIDQEMSDVLKRKEDMDRMKEEIQRTQAEETRTLQEIFNAQQQEREKNFVEQQIKEQKERQKNKLLEELDMMRRIRTQEVLQELAIRGVKKIGQVKISDMERKGEYDYDEVMNFYQMLLKKEKEAFEVEKQKKLKDVEFWARAVREEEKVAIEKYAKEHGEEEMKQIQRAIRERHEKELKMKQSLEKAQNPLLNFKAAEMAKRKEAHEKQMQDFINKKGLELQTKIVEEAKAELRKIENIRKVKETEERRKKQMQEKEQKAREEGRFGADEEAPGGWGRGTVKQPEVQPSRGPREDGGAPIMSRSAFGVGKTQGEGEEKKEETKRPPTFIKQQKKPEESDGGFLSRGQMGAAKKEEEKKEPTATPSAESGRPQPFRRGEDKKESGAGPWRSGAPQSKPASGGDDAFKRGGPATQPAAKKEEPKKNEKGDDGWSFSGNKERKPGGFTNSSKK